MTLLVEIASRHRANCSIWTFCDLSRPFSIVAHHSIEYFVPREYREALTDQTRGLSLFVDLFFGISGFVIAFLYQGRLGSLRRGHGNFMQRRVGRLFPLSFC